jgi:hypothetical protein
MLLLKLLLAPFLVLRWILGMDYPLTDRWQRPLIMVPGAKKAEAFTRVTTVAKTLSGQEALSEWKARMVAEGACLRPDILAQFAASLPTDPADKEQKALQTKLTEAMKEAAAGSKGANLGDALHNMTAKVDTDKRFKPLPQFEKAIGLYRDCIERHGLEIIPQYVERTVVLPEIKVAGSFDRIVRKAGRLFILDLKTGKDLSYSWSEIAIQLALYSRAKWFYDWDSQTVSDFPEVDQKIGLVLWLPYGQDKAELHVLDLEAGWEGAQQALWARSWRTRKDLARAARAN